HLQLHFHQMRERAANAAMAVRQQTSMRIERQPPPDVELALCCARAGFATSGQSQFFQQHGECYRETVVDGSTGEIARLDLCLLHGACGSVAGAAPGQRLGRADMLEKMR